jgi:dynein heavy chain, axonemal
VLPKKKKVEAAEKQLAEAQARLEMLNSDFAKLMDELAELDASFAQKDAVLKETQAVIEKLKKKIETGERLISGLADEKENWTKSLAKYREEFTELIGNCVLAGAYMSYCGPFPSAFRGRLHKQWLSKIKKIELPHKKGFTFIDFMATPD